MNSDVGDSGDGGGGPLSSPALAWWVVVLLEALIQLHTLWFDLGMVGFLLVSFLSSVAFFHRRPPAAAIGVGLVVGEAVGALIRVPFELSLLALFTGRYQVALLLFLRLLAMSLALGAWRRTRGSWGVDRAEVAALAGCFCFLVGIAMMGRDRNVLLLGHPNRGEVAAEAAAHAQLGPEYAGYHTYLRSFHLGPARGEGQLVRASVIAYSWERHDAFDLDVAWVEP